MSESSGLYSPGTPEYEQDVMARHRLANGGRGATAEQTETGKFTQAVRDQDAMDAIRMVRGWPMDEAQARVFLNELRAMGWDVTRQCGGGDHDSCR